MNEINEDRMAEVRALLDEATKRLVQAYAIQIEGLTERQTADAFRQAIACGDFTRYLSPVVNSEQQVVYYPYAREQELKGRIEVLKQQIERLVSTEYVEQCTQVHRAKIAILSEIIQDARPFLKRRYADCSSDDLGQLLDRIEDLNLK